MSEAPALSASSTWSDIGPGVATPSSKTDGELEAEKAELGISFSALLSALDGVIRATKAPTGEYQDIEQAFRVCLGPHVDENNEGTLNLSFRDWQARLSSSVLGESQQKRGCLAIVVAFLCECSRRNVNTSAADMDLAWSVIHQALTSSSIPFSVSRSSQGFLSVPLSSIPHENDIGELFRLHVWEPNTLRGTLDLGIHAHQPFLQSWILAGKGRDLTYKVHPAGPDTATHAEYDVFWSGGESEESTKTYQTKPKTSSLVNTGRLVKVVETSSETHSAGMTYSIPSSVFHRSEVTPGTFHATLVFFDSMQGFNREAAVLGPRDGNTYSAKREHAGSTAGDLAHAVNSVRGWATLFGRGMEHTLKAEWEEAVQVFQRAIHFCETCSHLPNAQHYKHKTMAELGHMYRMFGRNELAAKTLEEARHDMPPTRLRVQISGELAVVYRHMDQLDDSRRAGEDEYNTAQSLGLDRDMCRAIGTLGMINYQLSLTLDPSLITIAIEQLTERVDRARKLKAFAREQMRDITAQAEQIEWAAQREAIGLGRLCLCYQQLGDFEQAVSIAFESLQVQSTTRDPSKIGLARGFYGLALLAAGRPEEAVSQFNIPDMCSPIVSMAKEPSNEHREYIRTMVKAGADREMRDAHGYSALECAVYSGDVETQTIIEEALRDKYMRQAIEKLNRQKYEAVLRRGYRDLFQDQLRPVLLGANTANMIKKLRTTYALALDRNKEQSDMFDQLRYVRYTDFLQSGKLPRSTDGITQPMNLKETYSSKPLSMVFISYRWLLKDSRSTIVHDSPDDHEGTQYKRMIRALDLYLGLHPEISLQDLGIWLDFACIDQADHEQQTRGIAALLMNLAQCDAMISLVDDAYYERAWCCVEVLMMRTLKQAYGRHLWYQHTIDPTTKTENLRPGPTSLETPIDLSMKKVTLEADRPKLMFLERQTKLIS
ncbi:hypothetical protein F4808DRAFT_366306 [Astrocystis sublimbata]|nr:hypothetical protein F4808DRAFT_365813 [Astrocystis sublimbata]KAI0204011.1 hypothetical protein F4808DRAFT_366306 [Astrocystis sublimbata]